MISVGIFANGKYGAGWNGVVRECVRQRVRLRRRARHALRRRLAAHRAAHRLRVLLAVFGFAMAYVWFKISDLITPIRVSAETEIEGLDGPEMGAIAYPDFPVHAAGKRMAG